MKHVVILFVITAQLAVAQTSNEQTNQRIPAWARKVLKNNELFKNYELVDTINPFYFEEDFTGDEITDIVFMVKNKQSGKFGTFIINGGKNIAFVMGAGKPIGLGTNVSWCDKWYIYRHKSIYNFEAKKKKVLLRTPGIELRKSEEKSVVIYWDRRRYKTAIKNVIRKDD